MAWVYLIHLDQPLCHARHYIGYTALEEVDARLARHKEGTGARMLAVCNERDIAYSVVRTWELCGEWSAHEAKQLERKLKDQHHSDRYCPICKNGGKQNE